MQMQAAMAAGATREAALGEEKATLEARLQGTAAACTALETRVSGFSWWLHLPACMSCKGLR